MTSRFQRYSLTLALTFGIAALLGSAGAGAQGVRTFTPFAPTATAQTSPTMVLATPPNDPGYATATIVYTSTATTTVSFSLLGSADGGTTYTVIPVAYAFTPSTLLTTATVSSQNSIFVANLAGYTNVELQTNGTFTGTAVSIKLTASPYTMARVGPGFGANNYTGVQSAPGYTNTGGYVGSIRTVTTTQTITTLDESIICDATGGANYADPPVHCVQERLSLPEEGRLCEHLHTDGRREHQRLDDQHAAGVPVCLAANPRRRGTVVDILGLRHAE